MQAVVTAWSAIELLLRCVWERVDGSSKKDPNISHVEQKVFEFFRAQPSSLRRPPELTGFRNMRNSIAHSGAEPSQSDTARYLSVARVFARDLVLATWDEDLERLGLADVVVNERLRFLLKQADLLLTDPSHAPVLEDGTSLTKNYSEDERRLLAVGLARNVWNVAVRAMSFKWADPTDDPLGDPYLTNKVSRETVHLMELVRAKHIAHSGNLRRDLLALSLGVPLPNFRRFEGVRGAAIGRWSRTPQITYNCSAPTEEDARFAVDFVTDWVLRSEQHFDLKVFAPADDRA